MLTKARNNQIFPAFEVEETMGQKRIPTNSLESACKSLYTWILAYFCTFTYKWMHIYVHINIRYVYTYKRASKHAHMDGSIYI